MPQDALLLIDAQVTFMDAPLAQIEELAVPGSSASAMRTAAVLDQARDAIVAVVATFDSHSNYGIERPGFWIDANGALVPAWTQIALSDMREGRYRTADPEQDEYARRYLEALGKRGPNEKLMVWPVHGVLGTPGHALAEPIAQAVARWEVMQRRAAVRVLKGTCPLTEHYGAFEAEVPLDSAPETHFNQALGASISNLLATTGGRLLVAGQASSHCVPATLYQLARYAPGIRTRIAALKDCMNPVPGFEADEADFFEWVTAGGGEVITANEYISRIQ